MEAEIEQFKEESSQQEKNNNSRLRNIYKQQKKTESQAEDYEQQTSVISKILDDVKAGMEMIISIAVHYGSIWYSLEKQRNLLCFLKYWINYLNSEKRGIFFSSECNILP